MIVQCCVCQKLREDGVWVRKVVPPEEVKTISHTYCPSCLEETQRQLREELAKRRKAAEGAM